MKISYNWIKQFININYKAQKVAHDLTMLGHEVEQITKSYDDYILDISIASNRGDCLSIIGLCRELSALYEIPIKLPGYKFKTSNSNKDISINVKSKNICKRFYARTIDNIKVGKSPKWISDKLKTYGFKPINNIVDITNYVMIETGQPLHAFDYDKIKNGMLNIQLAANNDYLITLDGKERKINENTIIIKDDNSIYDLAGIMGGYRSEIDENTKTIILQSSVFNPINIRKTSKKLNLTTDASYRFERGVDVSMSEYASNLASHYIKLILPNSKISKISHNKFVKLVHTKIKYDYNKINNLLGTKLTKNKIDNFLKRLGFKILNNKAIVPSYRTYDATIWQDLAEEVAKLHGYNNLGMIHIEPSNSKININETYQSIETIKDMLINNGFDEIKSYSFSDIKILKLINKIGHEKYNFSRLQKVINSIAPEINYLRPSLLSPLITAVSKNPWAPKINIFEHGKVFNNMKESFQLALATTDKKAASIKKILSKLNIKTELIQIDQRLLDYLKIRKKVTVAIINKVDNIKLNNYSYNNALTKNTYKDISVYPPTIRDISIVLNKNIVNDNIKNTIFDTDDHIFIVELFDEYISDKFGKNNKSVAFHIWLQDYKLPLERTTSQKIITKIINKLKNKYKARLR